MIINDNCNAIVFVLELHAKFDIDEEFITLYNFLADHKPVYQHPLDYFQNKKFPGGTCPQMIYTPSPPIHEQQASYMSIK